jgi:hypothetical protein
MSSKKTNKKIELGGSIAIPMTYGGPPAFYDLVATIQHLVAIPHPKWSIFCI